MYQVYNPIDCLEFMDEDLYSLGMIVRELEGAKLKKTHAPWIITLMQEYAEIDRSDEPWRRLGERLIDLHKRALGARDDV